MPRKLRIQNRIGRSWAVLPVVALLTLALWWFPQGGYSHDYAWGLLLAVLVAYVVTETNNIYQLLRVRSRMISVVWLSGLACMGFFHPFHPVMLSALGLSVSHFLLFRTYQQSQPVADVFHAFLALALGSIPFPPLVLFALPFLWYLLVFMRALTFRGFFAALVGLALPFWFWGGWVLWQGDASSLARWWQGLVGGMSVAGWHISDLLPRLSAFVSSPSPVALAFLLFALLTVWTAIAYFLHSFDDKIRTRMMFYVYVSQSVLVLLFSLFAADLLPLLPLLLLSCSPLVAHYFTFRVSWAGLVLFFLTLLALGALAWFTLSP